MVSFIRLSRTGQNQTHSARQGAYLVCGVGGSLLKRGRQMSWPLMVPGLYLGAGWMVCDLNEKMFQKPTDLKTGSPPGHAIWEDCTPFTMR